MTPPPTTAAAAPQPLRRSPATVWRVVDYLRTAMSLCRRRRLDLLAAQQQLLLRHLEIQERLDRHQDRLRERERALAERERLLRQREAALRTPDSPYDMG
jgi:hypothetical protein